MKLAVMTNLPSPDPPRKLNLPVVRMLHRPQNTTQTIEDRKKATDLLLGLRIYLENRAS